MTAFVTDYTLENDSSKLVHHDSIKVNVNLHKTGSDIDVIKMWIRDEHVATTGTDLLDGFKITNEHELVTMGQKLEATGKMLW